ncbi:acyl-CoA thioesterase [Pseudoalteromonas sp. MMG013]|uniref:acyl-CoA thioesterase n=1 Tax=unclassified Pseudoalteromonas TaxID=194690 RepID=UPI001B37ADE5|nr:MULTISPECIES: acyl-CoA thioesterase [unclassified Pseudoalteromonas]MBQ4846073.1 acyl-CoA thioesterase [Pseudoalteromonas sp. MMG005]MBQ4851563.1 acyl-CoA thioesterase [Pseudoalteromonas sp. MMG012]MBQ4863547.1 acyl-CoA thioesterase [Pseudoalteromonas sp. MMG013]
MTDLEKENIIVKRIEESITSITKTVFPGRTNHHNTLFGGDALAWMDEAAFIAATRFCRKPLVTISSDRVDFKEAIPAGTFAELVSKVVHVGNTSLKVEVKIYLERMHKDDKHLAISGSFTFVAVDDNHRPTPVVCQKMLDGFN